MPTLSLNARLQGLCRRGDTGGNFRYHCAQVEEKPGAYGPSEISYAREHFLPLR